MVRQEIRRIVLSPFFYISIIIIAACNYIVAAQFMPSEPDLALLFDAGSMGRERTVVPLLAGLACADTYVIERKSGYYFDVISRTDRTDYCLAKVITAFMAGFFTVVFAKILYFISIFITECFYFGISHLTFGNHLVNTYGGYSGNVDPHAPYFIRKGYYFLYCLRIVFFDSLYASIFPGLSLVVSVFSKNRYIIMLFPYIYNCVMASVFITMKLYYISPSVLDNIGRADLLTYEGVPFRIIMALIYLGVEIVVFTYGVNREMRRNT